MRNLPSSPKPAQPPCPTVPTGAAPEVPRIGGDNADVEIDRGKRREQRWHRSHEVVLDVRRAERVVDLKHQVKGVPLDRGKTRRLDHASRRGPLRWRIGAGEQEQRQHEPAHFKQRSSTRRATHQRQASLRCACGLATSLAIGSRIAPAHSSSTSVPPRAGYFVGAYRLTAAFPSDR